MAADAGLRKAVEIAIGQHDLVLDRIGQGTKTAAQHETYLVLGVALGITYFARDASAQSSSPTATIVAGHTALFLWALVELMSQQHNPFLYFQF